MTRTEIIAQRLQAGEKRIEVARSLGMDPSDVSRIAKQLGLPGGHAASREREPAIVEMLRAGEKFEIVAIAHGVSRGRVSQIAIQYGIKSKRSPQARSIAKKETQ